MSNSKWEVGSNHVCRVPGRNLTGLLLLCLGRAINAPVCYLLFSHGWGLGILSTLGKSSNNAQVRVGPGIGEVGSVPTLQVALYAAGALRQIYWIMNTNTYEWPVVQSAFAVIWNLLVDIFNTYMTIRALNRSPPDGTDSFAAALGWAQWFGILAFIAGVIIETVPEESRKVFKRDLAHKGQLFDAGMWSIVRHPNYAGFILWRSGITLATGSTDVAIPFGLLYIAIFNFHAIPGLTEHMSKRYGDQWKAYTERVPCKLIPGIV